MTSFTEILMSPGEWECSFRHDPRLDAELQNYRCIQFERNGKLLYTGVLLQKERKPNREIIVGGFGLKWGLGGDEGPVIMDRLFLSGKNRLSNPGAELDLLDWRTGENSRWDLADPDNQRTGYRAFAVYGDPEGDDILQSDRDYEASAGEKYVFSLWAFRVYGERGILRGRVVCNGKFTPENLLIDPGFDDSDVWVDASTSIGGTAGDSGISGGQGRIGPVTRPQLLENPYPGDTDGWTYLDGAWNYLGAGGGAVTTTGGHYAFGPIAAQSVQPGEKYRIVVRLAVVVGTAATGAASLQINQWLDSDPPVIQQSQEIQGDVPGIQGTYFDLVYDVQIDEDHNTLWPIFHINGYDGTGTWSVLMFTITRVEDNHTALVNVEPFLVGPGRTYSGSFRVTSDVGVVSGQLKVVATYSPAVLTSRADVKVEAGSIDMTHGVEQLLEFSLNPPSGYDLCYLGIEAQDVYGGSFVIDDGRIVDNDNTTRVIEAWMGDEQASYDLFWEDFERELPVGTETIHVEVVAEEGSGGWVIDDLSLVHVGDPWVVGDIVRELLKDESTGLNVLLPGNIFGDDELEFDKRFRRTYNGKALDDLSKGGVVLPQREYRINPNFTLDWGLPEEIFVDRDLVFTQDRLELLSEPSVEETVENEVARVLLIGADQRAVGNRTSQVTAEALNDMTGKLDWFGNPMNRTRIIEDSTIEFWEYAKKKARLEANTNAAMRQNVALRITDWRTLEDFGVGDWIQAHLPTALLEDRTNPRVVRGRTVYPKKVRVQSRKTEVGRDIRVKIRRPDGSTIDVSEFVNYAPGTSADVEVGDLLPEFITDPQGGNAGAQFLAWRASRSL